MSSAPRSVRCSNCSINYPKAVRVCRVCGDDLNFYLYSSDPDEDWEEQVARLLGSTHDGSVYPHPPKGVCPRYKHEDRIWVKHDDLIRLGYRYLEGGSIVFIHSAESEERVFYELVLYWDEHEAWLIQEMRTEGVFDNAYPDDIIRAGEGREAP